MLIVRNAREHILAVVANLEDIEAVEYDDGCILRTVDVCPGVSVDVDKAGVRVFGVMVCDSQALDATVDFSHSRHGERVTITLARSSSRACTNEPLPGVEISRTMSGELARVSLTQSALVFSGLQERIAAITAAATVQD